MISVSRLCCFLKGCIVQQNFGCVSSPSQQSAISECILQHSQSFFMLGPSGFQRQSKDHILLF